MGSRSSAGERDGEDDGPLRLCAVSRALQPPEALIRFVAGPDSAIVPDLARKLPGRGVWVEARQEIVAQAVRQKVFARSLKRAVTVPTDLAVQVESLMRRRLAEAVSLCNKAGLLVAGFAKVDELIEAKRASLLLHAADAAADGMHKLDRKFNALRKESCDPARVVRSLTGTELSLAIGRPNVIHAAAAEGGASLRVWEEARRLDVYRHGETFRAPRIGQEPTQDVHD